MRKSFWTLGLALAICAVASAAVTKRPNIVVLVADDRGVTDLGAFGGEINTPHLDALAKSGVRFSNFHVAASCSPTRSTLLTGVDKHRNGVGNLREAMPTEHLGKPGYRDIQTLKDRSLYRQAIETARCLHENVLTSVYEANIGSTFGIGFPAWTGGAMQFVDGMGLEAFAARCDALAAKHGDGFALSQDVKETIARYQTVY